MIYRYAWGNNARRAELLGRLCVIEVSGRMMNTVLVRFLDTGERVTTSRRALRPHVIPTIAWSLPRPPVSKYRGGFPRFFEQNLVQLLGYPDRILHPFGGRAELGIRVDVDPLVEPDVVADAHALPFPDADFDLVVLDPPYSDAEALELYNDSPKLRPHTYTREAVRVLRPGGWLVVYGDREPPRPPRCNHTLRIMVTLRPHHRPRVAMVFQKRKPGMPHFGSEPGES